MTEEQEEVKEVVVTQEPPRSEGTTITGIQLLTGIIFVPVVMVGLALGARSIWAATENPETLNSIEGLLTALAVLSLPVSAGLSKLFEAFGNEVSSKQNEK